MKSGTFAKTLLDIRIALIPFGADFALVFKSVQPVEHVGIPLEHAEILVDRRRRLILLHVQIGRNRPADQFSPRQVFFFPNKSSGLI